MIVLKIDVTKIDKSRLFEGKNGAKYLDAVLIETPNNQYGDSHMIAQSVTKEERLAGVKGAIIGNAKTIGQTNGQQSNQTNGRPPRRQSAPPPAGSNMPTKPLPDYDDENIPF
jgi:hypothetical protein